MIYLSPVNGVPLKKNNEYVRWDYKCMRRSAGDAAGDTTCAHILEYFYRKPRKKNKYFKYYKYLKKFFLLFYTFTIHHAFIRSRGDVSKVREVIFTARFSAN